MPDEADKAIISKLSIRSWGATRTDKEVGEEVARSKNADPKAGKYIKNLIDTSALKTVRSTVQEMRDQHKLMSRPWDDDGRRLVPMGILPGYRNEMARLTANFREAVEDFAREYPGLRDYASMTLGEMFNEADYPADNEIAGKFSVEIDYEPVPKGEYAPPGYEAEVEKAVKRRMKESADELFNRIVTVLEDTARKIAEHDRRMEDGDKRGRFRLSVLDDLQDLAGLLPALNIENDPFLVGVHKRIEREILKATTPEALRDNGAERKLILAEVDALLDKFDRG